MNNILIENTNYLNENMEVQEHVSIVITEDKRLKILSSVCNETEEAVECIDGSNYLWMHGLCDNHMHTGQQLLRGKILDELPMIWTRIMLPFESTLTSEKMKLSAQLASLEMIRSGTTSFIDAGSYYMEAAAKVYLESGLRGNLTTSTMDNENVSETIRHTAKEAVAINNRLYGEFHGQGNLSVSYSLRSLISCTEELMEMVFETAKEKGAKVQAHMNEYPNEINHFLQKYQVRPFEYLEQCNYLSKDFIAAHSILLSENEKRIIKENGIKTVHCPFSNCGKGLSDIPYLMENDVRLSLGTDGTAHGGMSLWNEMKILRSIVNLNYGVSTANPAIIPAKKILKMATTSAVENQSKVDLIGINLNKPHLYPTGNKVNTLVESVVASDVEHMIVNGKFIMKNGEILTLDEERIMYEARKVCETCIL